MLAATREKDGSNEDPGQPKINKSIDYEYVVNRLWSGGFLQLSPGVRPRHQATVLLLRKKKKRFQL